MGDSLSSKNGGLWWILDSHWVHIRRGHDHAACCTRAS